MPVTNLPCGCVLTWGDLEIDLAFCENHDVEYEKWGGTDLEFMKMVATPKRHSERKYVTVEMEHATSPLPAGRQSG